MKNKSIIRFFILMLLAYYPYCMTAQDDTAPETTDEMEAVDTLTTSKILGYHWLGRELPAEGIEHIFLVNVKTGEYVTVGDYWGTASMLDHVGLTFKITPAERTVSHPASVIEHGSYQGYWIEIEGNNNSSNALGRAATSDGKEGAFETMRYIFSRDRNEYQKSSSEGANPGGFVWYFHPVKEDPKGGYIYNIFAFRRTKTMQEAGRYETQFHEYMGRESYLCLMSQPSTEADYNVVRFRKFAGKMYDNDVSQCMGDEIDIVSNNMMNDLLDDRHVLSLNDGLDIISNDSSAQWKIVTLDERLRYQLMGQSEIPSTCHLLLPIINSIVRSVTIITKGKNRKGKQTWDGIGRQETIMVIL